MNLFKDNTTPRQSFSPSPEAREPARVETPPKPALAPSLAAAPAPAPAPTAGTALPRKESLIAADITIEGKIEGSGSVRIAGKFKGDVGVQGDLALEVGAKLTGSVRAAKVTIAGELEGNVDEASQVDLLQTGVVIGDLKTGALTVAAGARMRGHAEFGWGDTKLQEVGRRSNADGLEGRLSS